MSTKKGVAELVARLRACFPSGTYTPEMVTIWHEHLLEFEDEALLLAADALARNHTYGAPGTAHVIEAILGRRVRLPVPSGFLMSPGGPPRVDEWRDAYVPLGEPTPCDWDEALAMGYDEPGKGHPGGRAKELRPPVSGFIPEGRLP